MARRRLVVARSPQPMKPMPGSPKALAAKPKPLRNTLDGDRRKQRRQLTMGNDRAIIGEKSRGGGPGGSSINEDLK